MVLISAEIPIISLSEDTGSSFRQDNVSKTKKRRAAEKSFEFLITVE
jgi:hypothetical protein